MGFLGRFGLFEHYPHHARKRHRHPQRILPAERLVELHARHDRHQRRRERLQQQRQPRPDDEKGFENAEIGEKKPKTPEMSSSVQVLPSASEGNQSPRKILQ